MRPRSLLEQYFNNRRHVRLEVDELPTVRPADMQHGLPNEFRSMSTVCAALTRCFWRNVGELHFDKPRRFLLHSTQCNLRDFCVFLPMRWSEITGHRCRLIRVDTRGLATASGAELIETCASMCDICEGFMPSLVVIHDVDQLSSQQSRAYPSTGARAKRPTYALDMIAPHLSLVVVLGTTKSLDTVAPEIRAWFHAEIPID